MTSTFSISDHVMHGLISYTTCAWPEMYSFHQSALFNYVLL